VHDGGLTVGTRHGRHTHTGPDQLQPQTDFGDDGHAPLPSGPKHGMTGTNAGAGDEAVGVFQNLRSRPWMSLDTKVIDKGAQAVVVTVVGDHNLLTAREKYARGCDARLSEPVYQGRHGFTLPRCRGRCSRGRTPQKRKPPGRSRTGRPPCSHPSRGTRSDGVWGPS